MCETINDPEITMTNATAGGITLVSVDDERKKWLELFDHLGDCDRCFWAMASLCGPHVRELRERLGFDPDDPRYNEPMTDDQLKDMDY